MVQTSEWGVGMTTYHWNNESETKNYKNNIINMDTNKQA